MSCRKGMTFVPLSICETSYRHAVTSFSQDVLVRRAGVTDAVRRICIAFTLNRLGRGEEALKAKLKMLEALG